jgi:hypothetical protein
VVATEDEIQHIVTPDECYEHFHKIIEEQRPTTSVELVAQAYLGIMVYHTGMQLNLLSRQLMSIEEEATDGNGEAQGDAAP